MIRAIAATGLSVFVTLTPFLTTTAQAKKPGRLSCYKTNCWRVASLDQLSAVRGVPLKAAASHYDVPERDPFNPKGLTSSGEVFDASSNSRISSSNLPNGTIVALWSPVTGIAAKVLVNNTGPFMGNRVIDVPAGLAREMGFFEAGVADLRVVVLQVPCYDIQQGSGIRLCRWYYRTVRCL